MTVTIISDNTTGLYAGDYAGTEDTYLRDATIRGAEALIKITKYNSGAIMPSLIRFSGLSNIAASETVSDATIGINKSGGIYVSDHDVSVRRLLRNWNEAVANSTDYDTGLLWTTAKAGSDGNDRSATVSATQTIGSANGFYTFNAAQLTTDFNDKVQGTVPNYGWHFDRTDAGLDSQSRDFDSSEGTNGQRPYALVTHSAGGGGNPWYYYQTMSAVTGL